MLLPLYRLVTTLSGPAIRAYLRRRKHRGKEDPRRMEERFGIPSRARPPGRLVWVHAASVGEAQSVLALIHRLLAERPGLHILATTGTVASARLLENRLPHGAFHQYVPVDRAAWVRRFLKHWKPDLVLWVESELWPNLVVETRKTGAPMVLVNGRISPRSYANWRRAPALARRLLGAFALAFAQSAHEAERFRALGAPRVVAPGNLKYAADPLPADEAAVTSLEAAIGTRPVWLAASTHAGEERAAAEVHTTLAKRFPDLLTVIVPRHPSRAAALAVELAPLRSQRRSLGALPRGDTAIYLGDTMGEMGLFYRTIPVVFMGGSLVPHGGQNLVEPARHGAAILHGPHMHNFAEIVAEMGEAIEEVRDAAALTAAVEHLLADPVLRKRRGDAARAAAEEKRQVIDAVLAELAPFLDRLDGHARA